MIAFLESRWKIISILLVLILLAVLIFMPSISGTFSVFALLVSLGMAIAFIVRRQLKSYRSGKINRAGMLRNITVEIFGLLFTIALAFLIVRRFIETMNLSSGLWEMGIAIALSLLIGLVIGWLVKVTWGRLTTSKSD
ncbi:MAG: hypothetical protein WCA79_02215 [Anaerolineales bacterium]